MTDIDPSFLFQRIDRLIDETAELRKDVAVITAVVIRTRATMNIILTELRASQARWGRLEKELENR